MADLEDTQPLIVAEFSQGGDLTQKVGDADQYNDILSLQKKQPIAFLKINTLLENVDKEYPLFGGSNLIGREKSCRVYLPHIISKKHACIEIEDDVHLIFDCGSLNKTKRRSQTLIPQVRYELTEGISLTFADVECSFSLISTLKTSNISLAHISANSQKPLAASLLSKCFSSGDQSPDLLSQELELNDDDDDDSPIDSVFVRSKNFVIVEDSPAVHCSIINNKLKEENFNADLSVVKETQSFQNAESSLRLNLTSSSDSDSDLNDEEKAESKVDNDNKTEQPEEVNALAEKVEGDALTSLGGCSVERILGDIADNAAAEDLALQEILHGPSTDSDCLFIGETAPFFDGTPVDIKNLRKKNILSALDLYSSGTRDGDDEIKKEVGKKTVSFESNKDRPEVKEDEIPSTAKAQKKETAARDRRTTLPERAKKSPVVSPPERNSLDVFLGQRSKRTRKSRKKIMFQSKTSRAADETPEENKEKPNRKSRKNVEKKVENVEKMVSAVVEEPQKTSRRSRTLKSTQVLLSTPKDLDKVTEEPALPPTPSDKRFSSKKPKISQTEELSSSQKSSLGKRGRSKKLNETVNQEQSPKKKTKMEKYEFKVAFTGVSEKNLKSLTKIASDLGSLVEDSVRECTHLVAEQVKRTAKFLCAVARGVPIVSPEWLQKSKAKGKFEEAQSYLLMDKDAEENFGFSLADTLDKAQKARLFDGYSIYVTPSVSKPPPSELQEILICAGGKVLPKLPTKRNSSIGKCFVISCEEDKKMWNQIEKLNLKLVSIEFVLSGLLKHQLDFDKHIMNVS